MRTSTPTLPSMGERELGSAASPSMMHNQKRDGVGHGVAKAREQAEQKVEAEADIVTGNGKTIIYQARDEPRLVEPLLMGQPLAVVAPAISGGLAAPPYSQARPKTRSTLLMDSKTPIR
jgi:hypothetical protein